MQLTYDELTDTLYLSFTQEPMARSSELSDRVIVDDDASGAPIHSIESRSGRRPPGRRPPAPRRAFARPDP